MLCIGTFPELFWSCTLLICQQNLQKLRVFGFSEHVQYLRLHVEQVTDSHVGIALAVAIALREEFVLRPRHVNVVRAALRLVVYCGVRRCVSVVDELGLETADRED